MDNKEFILDPSAKIEGDWMAIASYVYERVTRYFGSGLWYVLATTAQHKPKPGPRMFYPEYVDGSETHQLVMLYQDSATIDRLDVSFHLHLDEYSESGMLIEHMNQLLFGVSPLEQEYIVHSVLTAKPTPGSFRPAAIEPRRRLPTLSHHFFELNEMVYEGYYDPNDLWNGFSKVWLTLEAAQQLVLRSAVTDTDEVLSWLDGATMHVYNQDDAYTIPPQLALALDNGKPIALYPTERLNFSWSLVYPAEFLITEIHDELDVLNWLRCLMFEDRLLINPDAHFASYVNHEGDPYYNDGAVASLTNIRKHCNAICDAQDIPFDDLVRRAEEQYINYMGSDGSESGFRDRVICRDLWNHLYGQPQAQPDDKTERDAVITQQMLADLYAQVASMGDRIVLLMDMNMSMLPVLAKTSTLKYMDSPTLKSLGLEAEALLRKCQEDSVKMMSDSLKKKLNIS